MDQCTILKKTPKGVKELTTKRYQLSPECRSTLILIDGKLTVGQIYEKYSKQGNVIPILEKLVEEGYAIDPEDQRRTLSSQSEQDPGNQHDIEEIKRHIADQIKKSFGFMATPLLNKLRECKSINDIYAHASHCRMLIQESSNAKKAEIFWDTVQKYLTK